ncbi:MAG: peptidoglycan DD-metalloendopeptidase family protein [Candidatus Omnitrophica bacterium]|nr:peptidoglycan DD-metalloendopeptidase family protein [Candidatus Omnitrophota bacterium]
MIFAFCILNFFGCATLPTVMPTRPEGIPGIYHRVERGQTLWRISKLYNLDLEELAAINRISDATKIEVGQLIFIPHRQKQAAPTKNAQFEDFIWPLRGRVITAFGYSLNNMVNKGLNIQAEPMQEIVAARSGQVVFYSDDFAGYGKTVIIDHGDGFSTVYARNKEVFVKIGDRIEKGRAIARAGSTNKDKNVYLHFEIRNGYLAQNPYFYLP